MNKSVFNATYDVNNRVTRNSFDWSFANNLTFNFGKITPVFCELVPPASSCRINPKFGLQFMPMVFPVQTRMKARLSFYKVPVRTLWKDYTDFVGNFKKNLIPPYLNVDTQEKLDKMLATGTLGDYLNVPTEIYGKYGSDVVYTTPTDTGYLDIYPAMPVGNYPVDSNGVYNFLINNPSNVEYFKTEYTESEHPNLSGFHFVFTKKIAVSSYISIDISDASSYIGKSIAAYYDSKGNLVSTGALTLNSSTGYIDISLDSSKVEQIASMYIWCAVSSASNAWTINSYFKVRTHGTGVNNSIALTNADKTPIVFYQTSEIVSSKLNLSTSPWYNASSPNAAQQLALSAYPFRACEAIYNAYYRNPRNNPYILNGNIEYNKWIPTDEGGADNNLYELHNANWETDFLTSAVQSPQQGKAPLVGITNYSQKLDGVSSVSTTNSDGTMSVNTYIKDEDGKHYRVNFSGKEGILSDVTYTPVDNETGEYAAENARSLYDLAQSGISIPDLRYVNAYQRYLEMNMRKNYSYRNVIEGHFDTKVKYDALLLPEFIGGQTEDVYMNSVTQTVEMSSDGSYAGALGSMAGNAGVRSDGGHPITCYCDEESYIIGLITVVPIPTYSQLLPKHFLHRELLDSYYPEFDNLGFQPITYKEVCPLQAYNDDPASLNDTFGYQRAWYEYISKVDQVHGLFRTNMRNFLINRVFEVKPTLAPSFLLVDNKQVNDVFSVTETSDKIFGQVYYDASVQLPISRVSIPKLE